VSHHEFFFEEEKPVLPLFRVGWEMEFFGEAQIVFLEFPADQLFSRVDALDPCW